ncbi:hypothetical protein, partial [Klebsiella pneumoniae]|uniref:hypothetical protein n=1 Tax=Klebsiella pneumoniae TaxID=573 RepID=UPI003CEDBA52
EDFSSFAAFYRTILRHCAKELEHLESCLIMAGWPRPVEREFPIDWSRHKSMIAVDLEIEWAHPGYLKRRADDALEA